MPTPGRLFIGNLPHDIRDTEMHEIFGKFGTIRDVVIKTSRRNPQLPAYCFLQYEDSSAVRDAIDRRDQYDVDGMKITVQEQTGRGPRDERFGPYDRRDDDRHGDRREDDRQGDRRRDRYDDRRSGYGDRYDDRRGDRYDDRRGGYGDRYDDRRSDRYDDRRGGYGDRYDDRRGDRYDDRRGGYGDRVDDRRGGYGDRFDDRRGGYGDRPRSGRDRPRGGRGGPRRGPGFRLSLGSLPPTGSWQDIKDHFREFGDILHADFNPKTCTGVVEFAEKESADRACDKMHLTTFKSHKGDHSEMTVEHEGGRGANENGDVPDRNGTSYDVDGDKEDGTDEFGRERRNSVDDEDRKSVDDVEMERDVSPAASIRSDSL